MKVLHVSEHCCSRVVKEGEALKKAGVECAYMQQRLTNPDFQPMLSPSYFYTCPEQLADQVVSLRDIDIIHVHNEPDWMAHICKQARPDIPVVFDAHDLFSVRLGIRTPDEELAFNKADAFIYPSKGYLEFSLDFHKDKQIHKRPNVVVYSCVNDNFIITDPLPRLDSIVYEGGLRVPEPENGIPEEHKYHKYRDYRRMFWWLGSKGLPVVVFCANPDVVEVYMRTGAFVLPPMEYTVFMEQLSRFSWGIAGGPIHHPQWETAMPHKLFEYLAAGVPVLTFFAKEVQEFVKEHGVGVVLDDWRQIPDVYQEHEKYRKVVLEKRHLFTMENEVDKILKIYQELV